MWMWRVAPLGEVCTLPPGIAELGSGRSLGDWVPEFGFSGPEL
jgi:hypothetical protein